LTLYIDKLDYTLGLKPKKLKERSLKSNKSTHCSRITKQTYNMALQFAFKRGLSNIAAFAAPALASTSVRGFAAQPQAIVSEEHDTTNDSIEAKGIKLSGSPVYLDVQATSPVDPRVMDAMLPYLTEQYGNPHSRTHLYGWEAEEAVETARKQIASLIGADSKEIIFTSGATESNNMAIKGVAGFLKDKKRHIITVQTDHKCVLDSCRHLSTRGWDITYLPVKSNGLIDLQQLAGAIRPNETALVSVMMVNNEVGVVQPMAEIGKMCREKGIWFHTDAAQGIGKIPIDVNAMNIDLMSISGHKVYGPKGVGALYVRRRPRVRLEAQMSGGGQERGLRSGTVPTPLVVGLGTACQVAKEEMAADTAHIKKLADRLVHGITSQLDAVTLNGDDQHRYWGNVNLSFAYVEGESLLMGLKDVAVSSGSACTSASLEPSYVLRALGVEEDMAHTSIRFGIGRFSTEDEVDKAVELTVERVRKLREMSPLWEMVQEGVDLKSIQWSQH
jgi:cysteine desulfurase